DRAVVLHTENLGRHVDLADIDEATRAQLELEEVLAVATQGHLVVDARGHVAEMCGWHVVAAHRLEVEDVDRLLRRLYQLVRFHRPPHQGIGQLVARQEHLAGESLKATGGEQRTAGEKLQEPAAIGSVISKRRHASPPEETTFAPSAESFSA